MSAITGIFYRDGRSVDSQMIKKMNDRLSHRGPDGSNTWSEGSVALGHQMLYTTPESLQEELPFMDKETGLVITADARIDNRVELSELLGLKNNEKEPDSLFILKAYEKWGESCPEKLLGDFVFAIWDPNKEQLFCARDHMGVKPFYYYSNDNMFVFGTEIKALVNVPGVPYELNELKIAKYLMKDTLDHEITFYKNIMNLSSAHSLKLDKYGIKIRRYWKLDPKLEIIMESEEDYAKAFQKIFSEAVKCRLRSHYPWGSELSGGLDSSSIVCMAKKILSHNKVNLKNINTFSRIFDDTPESDERYYITKVTDDGEINYHFINVDKISPLENIDTILWYQDQPFYTPHMTKQIRTYKKINNEGVRVLLSGIGGDLNFSLGTNYIRELAATFQLKKLIREIYGLSHNFNERKYKIIIEKVIFPSLPLYLKKMIKIFFGKNNESILNKHFFDKLELDKANIINLDYLSRITSKEYHYYILNYAFNETVLETVDRRVAKFNIEVRFPFYDKRLVEFCYAIPAEMKLKYGWSKYVLRLAMENILPSEIQWRPQKTDLSPTYKKNLLLFEHNILEKMIYNDNKIIKDYIDLEKLQGLFEKYKVGNGQNEFDIWIVVLLYSWLKYTDIKS